MSNKTPQKNKGNVAPMPNNMPAMGGPQPNFMNFPNQLQIPFQNNQPGMPHLVRNMPMFQGQYPVGFMPQNTVPNMNNVPAFQLPGPFLNMGVNGNQVNMSQQPGQMPMTNMVNVPQHFNPNPYGQYTVQFPMQHMNQINPMQMLNPFVPMFPNQLNQAMGAVNHGFNTNLLLGQHGNPNMQNATKPSMDVNASFHQHTQNQQSQGNLSAPSNGQSVQTLQMNDNTQHWRHQNNHVEGGRKDFSKSNGNKFNKQNFKKNSKGDKSHSRFQQSQSPHMQNLKRHSASSGKTRGNGFSSDRSGAFGPTTNHAMVQKKSTSVNYTEQEIKQWRSERKKNYPSKANINKKLTENITKTGVIDSEAKLRRTRIKEILAKQAELGVEVAEIPPQYLSDSEHQINVRHDNRNGPNNEKLQNKRNSKQRRNHDGDLFRKKQKYGMKDSSGETFSSTRKPTLLQKLLSSDIERNKSHLLQVFRFMVMNSFFKDAPDKPLAFPVVTRKRSEHEELEALDQTLIKEIVDQLSTEDEEGEITP